MHNLESIFFQDSQPWKLKIFILEKQQMGKQRDEGSESVTQQVQSRDIDVKKSDKFSSEYNLSLLFYKNLP